jgi:hypothetical protein
LITPPTGVGGTHVSAEVHLFGTTVANYVLRATTSSPDQGGCATSVALDDAPLFPAGGPAGGQVAFDWPAALGSDQYWLCAFLATGGPVQGQSEMPFVVTRDAIPTVSVVAPTIYVPLGATMTVSVTRWLSDDHSAPQHVWLASLDGYSRYDLSFEVVAGPDATGAVTLRAILPSGLPPYTITQPSAFMLIAGGPRFYQRSASVAVVPADWNTAPLPTQTATNGATPPLVSVPGTTRSGEVLVVLVSMALLALTIVSSVVIAVVAAWRRSRREKRD